MSLNVINSKKDWGSNALASKTTYQNGCSLVLNLINYEKQFFQPKYFYNETVVYGLFMNTQTN